MADAKFLVHFDRIMVNSIGTSAGVFIGTNLQYGWSSHNKSNSNISDISGTGNTFTRNVNVICDNDLIDTPIDDRDVFLSGNRTVRAS
jgi:hypothetical protein